MFGLAALGVVEALVEPEFGPGLAKLLGALAFAIGLVFLVVGRSELFTENFSTRLPRRSTTGVAPRGGRLLRLGGVTLVLNLVGGAVLLAVLTVERALPEGAPDALIHTAEEIAAKTPTATLARAVLAGALLTLLSYLLHAVGTVASIIVAYMAGFLVALGPFDHVVVSVLQLLFGALAGSTVSRGDIGTNVGLSAIGNLVGGLLLITLTHTAQVKGPRGGR